jgi:HEAT repeat protein
MPSAAALLATRKVRAWTMEAERLLTLRESHRLPCRPAGPQKKQPTPQRKTNAATTQKTSSPKKVPVTLVDDTPKIETSPPGLAEMLKSSKASERQRALDALAKDGSPHAIGAISQCLLTDRNENLRSHCADLLGSMGADALPALIETLRAAGSPRSVRVSTARALGLQGTSAIDALAQAARNDRADEVRSAAVQALAKGGGPEVSKALLDALQAAKAAWVRAEILHALGRIADSSVIASIQTFVRDPNVSIAKAAIGAIAQLDARSLIPIADGLLRTATDVKIRRRLAAELSTSMLDDAIPPLARALVSDDDDIVRDAAAKGLASFQNVTAKLDALIAVIMRRDRPRADLPSTAIARAMRFPADANGTEQLTEQLLSRATQATPPLTGVLADILVANYDGDPDSVGRAIDAYETAHQTGPGVFEPLRIEVGGTLALDPILKVLHEDLQRNFQQPIRELNTQTTKMWTDTIASARKAFIVRTVMSVCVFVLGVGLIAVSVVLFISGDLTTSQIVGSGTAFTGGLVATLLTVYSGPLKDIRQSVSDLGAANVAFIGFVHQVLQVSHTFTAHYLQGTVTFEQAQQAAAIITSASTTAANVLAATGSSARSTSQAPPATP